MGTRTRTHKKKNARREMRELHAWRAMLAGWLRECVRAHETSQFAFARRLSDDDDDGDGHADSGTIRVCARYNIFLLVV